MYEGFMALGIAAGGQLTTTDEVENYPGFSKIRGGKLMDQMREQSEAAGTEIISQTVAKVDLKSRPFKYWLHPMGDDEEIEEEEHTADSLIIATGAKARRLDLKGEDKYWGNGVSACAVCDGSLPMFRDQPLVVIGGGDSAVEEALYLTKKAKKVTVLVRRDKLRASRANARRLTTHPKIDIKYNTSATEIKGEEKKNGLMTHLLLKTTLQRRSKPSKPKGCSTPLVMTLRRSFSRISWTWMRMVISLPRLDAVSPVSRESSQPEMSRINVTDRPSPAQDLVALPHWKRRNTWPKTTTRSKTSSKSRPTLRNLRSTVSFPNTAPIHFSRCIRIITHYRRVAIALVAFRITGQIIGPSLHTISPS